MRFSLPRRTTITPRLASHALQNGLHVLVEKPISVHKADCERLMAAHTDSRQVFAAVLNQRTDPSYMKVREMIRNGELGEIRRINWIITNWFRSAAYYASSDWRATWAGEGGGVLLNQCLHNLDLFQWLFGMPQRVRGFCRMGRYHDIEVEDDVTAYFEYANDATAIFITSTGEAPGTNRLEVAAENGRLVLEDNALVFTKNEVPMSEFSRTTDKQFAGPATNESTFTFPNRGGQHVEILQNFVDAILGWQAADCAGSRRDSLRRISKCHRPLLGARTRLSNCRWTPPSTNSF